MSEGRSGVVDEFPSNGAMAGGREARTDSHYTTVRGGALYTLLLSPAPAHTHATLDHRQLQLSLHTWKWKVGKQ